MPKTKSSKRFSKNFAANIQHKNFVNKVKKNQKIKEKKLLERDFSDSEDEAQQREERHFSLMKDVQKNTSLKEKTQQKDEKNKEITAEEIADFWKKLETNEEVEDDEEDVNKLISNVNDDFDIIEVDETGNFNTEIIEDMGEDEESEVDEEERNSEDISDNEDELKEDGENEQEDGEDEEIEENDEAPKSKNKKSEKSIEKKFSELFGVKMNLKSNSEEYIKKVLISKELSQSWIESIQEGKKQKLKQMLVAYYTVSLQFGERTPEEETAFQLSPFRIDSPSVYMRIILGSLRFAPESFWKILNIPSTTTTMPNKALLKKKILPHVTLFCKATLRIFSHLTKIDALKYALQYLIGGLPFFSANIVHAKNIVKIILKLLHHTDDVIRVRSFMVLHEIASKFQKPIPDLVLKGVYYSYFEFATECTPENIKRLEFHRNCITELYGVNFDLSYKHAYSYIRGLAETFQTASKDNSIQKRKALINWRFVNCLECWTHVLSTYHATDELGELIFPFTQLVIGVAVLFKENTAWTPLRLRLAAMLNKLAASSKLFIPSSSILLSMLKERQVVESKKQSSMVAIDFDFSIRVSDRVIKFIEFQRAALNEWIYLIAGFLVQYAKSPAFPEVSQPVLRSIVTFRHEYFGRNVFGTSDNRKKVMNDSKFLESLKKLQKAIEEHTNIILQKRSRITFSPQDILKSPEKANGLLFEEDKQTTFDKYYETMKKEHDADVLRRMMSYQDVLQGKEKKDEIDEEADKIVSSVEKEKVKELKKEIKAATLSGEKRKREADKKDKPRKKSKQSSDKPEDIKKLKISSFFESS